MRPAQLDLTGPFEVLHMIPGAQLHLVWKSLEPVVADSHLTVLPTTTLGECPALDVLFVPGGRGQMALMRDEETLGFLRAQGRSARYRESTSACDSRRSSLARTSPKRSSSASSTIPRRPSARGTPTWPSRRSSSRCAADSPISFVSGADGLTRCTSFHHSPRAHIVAALTKCCPRTLARTTSRFVGSRHERPRARDRECRRPCAEWQ